MDQTVLIAVVTATAGVLGGVTTGLVGVLAARSQQRRVEAAEERAWRRDLAERDRERLHALAEEITVQQHRLFMRTVALMDQPAPQRGEDQLAARDAANDLALLCARAGLLGADGVESDPLVGVSRDLRARLRETTPLTQEERDSFRTTYNAEAGRHRDRLAANLRRLRG
ncbi:hypothetical protein LG324_16840 [Phycicoccus jejuensis]|uniref:hypothetical protein n=1 Tax=Phycicoccus jejuensis TaxID=367299 RepID=UPI00385034CD